MYEVIIVGQGTYLGLRNDDGSVESIATFHSGLRHRDLAVEMVEVLNDNPPKRVISSRAGRGLPDLDTSDQDDPTGLPVPTPDAQDRDWSEQLEDALVRESKAFNDAVDVVDKAVHQNPNVIE